MTGVGSVFSYPALLGVGLPAVVANVTNTVALAIDGLGGVYGSRPELTGQAAAARRLCLAGGLGSLVGSVLLLASPPEFFERVVPFLVAAASVSILRPQNRVGGSETAADLAHQPVPLGKSSQQVQAVQARLAEIIAG